MSTFFVNVACFFVFFVASLHHVHPEAMNITIFQNGESNNFTKVNTVKGDQILSKKRESVETLAGPETARNRRNTFIETNRVAGNQILSKKRESVDALAGPETARDRRMTVIEHQVIEGGQIFRRKRETPAGEEINQNRRNTFIETNRVAGDQILSKKRESIDALAGPETDKDRRMTVIGNTVITKSGKVFRTKRETLAGDETNQNRRNTFIETNRVAGDQILSKKSENVESLPAPEMVRNRRMTVFQNANFVGLPLGAAQMFVSNPSRVDVLPNQSVAISLPPSNLMNSSPPSFPGSQSVSSPLVALSEFNGQRTPVTAFPSFVKELTVNGNQFLSKK